MFFRLVLFAVLAYVFLRFIRVITDFFKSQKKDNSVHSGKQSSKIKKEDIIEADFEEIEETNKDEKKI